MVSILAAVVSLVVVLIVGQSELLLIVLAGFVLIGLFYRQAAIFALLCFVCVLAINAFIVNDYFNFVFYLVTVYVLRNFFQAHMPKSVRLIWIPVFFTLGLVAWRFQQLPFLIILVFFVSAIPLKNITSKISKTKCLFEILFFVIVFTSVITWICFHTPRQFKTSAILDNGKWAKVDVKYSLSDLDISSAYSYSEFQELLGAVPLKIELLGPEIDELWVITPTAPFSETQKIKLLNWVAQGGHLIMLTDHTDLYGHARVANSVLEKFEMFTNYSATFLDNEIDYVDDSLTGKFKLMTGTAIGGWNVWPTLTGLGYEENVYYGNPNFFGPLQPSGDDKFMRLALGGKKKIGSGYVTLLADSTPFSNFAVYQPGTPQLIQKLRQIRLFPSAYPFIPLMLIVSALPLIFKKSLPLLLVPLIGITIPIHFGSLPLNWGPAVQLWSGDKSLVIDQRNPEHSFSTAFAIATLSGKKPMWVEQISSDQIGVWVGDNPPPNPEWKWLDTDVDDKASVQNGDQAYQQLLSYLRAPYPLGWDHIQCDRGCPRRVSAGHIWTNDVMGDWWFERGLSPSRIIRFQSFLSWLNDKSLPEVIKPSSPGKTNQAWLVKTSLESKSGQLIEFPMPVDGSAWDKPILLGRGISAQIVKTGNSTMFVGLKSFNEAWVSPEIWVAEKQLSKSSK